MKDDLIEIISRYRDILMRFNSDGVPLRRELDEYEHDTIGSVFNRIIYKRDTPRVERPFSGLWEPKLVEDDFLGHPNGIMVVDNFLSDEALQSLRHFCLESTIWFENRYSYGRLGAFFRDGFSCPLLLQIADELRSVFPRIIGTKYPLHQLWGFKFNRSQPPTHPHADFAAVNVNFWITPDEANLETDSGGMEIYDMEAPSDWDFDTYNRKGLRITEFLKEKKAHSIKIPYKANRAIIFNSDLFHGTSPLSFKEGYANRRINITFLYGKRESAALED